MRDEPRDVVGRRDVAAVEPGRIGEGRVTQAERGRHRVHLFDEPGGAPRRHAGERARGDVVRRHQRQMQEVVQRHHLAAAKIRGRRAPDVAPGDHDVAIQVRTRIEEHERRHHLGDAGDGPLLEAVRLPQDLVGRRVVDHRGAGADARLPQVGDVEPPGRIDNRVRRRRRRGNGGSRPGVRRPADRPEAEEKRRDTGEQDDAVRGNEPPDHGHPLPRPVRPHVRHSATTLSLPRS